MNDKYADVIEKKLCDLQRCVVAGKLAGGVSHDFNNNISGISGFANLIKIRSSEEKIKSFASKILDLCVETSRTVSEFINFVRERGHSDAVVDVNVVLANMTRMISVGVKNNVTIERDLADSDCMVRTNAAELQAALLNILINARDATQDGGVISASTRVEPSSDVSDAGGRVAIVISDDGCGFDAGVVSPPYDPFATTAEDGRIRLGLSSTYRYVVGSMRGTMDVDSKVGAGTKVTITLPLHR